MAKQLNVNLVFDANINAAKTQIQTLQNQLKQLQANAMTSGGLGITKDAGAAIAKITELQTILQSATTAAGTLDLGKFQTSLSASHTSLKTYASTLQQLGPQGVQAFNQLNQAISMAAVPLRKAQGLLHEFGITLRNTLKWQVASTVLHSMAGAIQSAYGYAQDLNKSLNNIRIVTGYNIDQMKQFADQANKAAKALSTTTTEYTNASLIYYQQGGLSDAEIVERANITVKMANVVGQSAETVSDQLTAIWNNFDDGTRSLEYYVDVITALGAETASSTDEIAEGLEKFAAVAETVGLSYEYSTAALATVTATTRQSADIVGNAFKTLFARIQGLNLGETLDDGTTLNKYSEALASVGISIFEQNGELKTMDNILDEMGSKWNTLSSAQQTALAQTVAGVRQYTQLVALMENWDYFQKNLNVAENSAGTLQEQADIYAESWEAAANRVQASAEGVYDALINDEFFIDLYNNIATIIEGFEHLITSIGGVQGVLTLASALMFKFLGPSIVTGIQNIVSNIFHLTNTGKNSIEQMRQEANKLAASMARDSTLETGGLRADIITKRSELIDKILVKNRELAQQGKKMTAEEEYQLQLLNEQTSELEQQILTRANRIDNSTSQINIASNQILSFNADDPEVNANIAQQLSNAKQLEMSYTTLSPLVSNLSSKFQTLSANQGKNSKVSSQLIKEIKLLDKSMKKQGTGFYDASIATKTTDNAYKNFIQTVKKSKLTNEELENAFKELTQTLQGVGSEARNSLNLLEQEMIKLTPNQAIQIQDAFKLLRQELGQSGQVSAETIELFAQLGVQIDTAGNIIKRFQGPVYNVGHSIMALGTILQSVSFGIQTFKGLIDTWNNQDLSFGEKLLQTFMSLSMVLPMLTTAFNQQNLAQLQGIKNTIAEIAVKKGYITQQAVENGQLTTEIILRTLLNAQTLKYIAIIALVAAAVGALIALGKAFYDWYNQDAQALEAASSAAENAAKALDEVKSSYESLQNAITKHDELQNSLEELTEGTKEWNEALAEANAHTTEMLRQYPELAKYLIRDGELFSFTPEGLDQISKVYADRLVTTESHANTAKIAQLRAQNRYERTEALRSGDIADTWNSDKFWATIGTKAAIGLAVGGMTGNPIAASISAVGMAVEGLIDATNKNFERAEESELALEKLEAAYLKHGDIIFQSEKEFANALDGISDESIAALWENKTALETLTVETINNTEQMKALIQANAGNVNKDNEYYQSLSKEDKELMDIIIANRAAQDINNEAKITKLEEEIKNSVFGATTGFWGMFTPDNYDEYLKARFGDEAENYRVIHAEGKNATLQEKVGGVWKNYQDSEKDTLTQDEVVDTLVSYKLQQISEKIDSDALAKIQKVENLFAGTNASSEDILSLQKDLLNGTGISLIEFDPETVNALSERLKTEGGQLTRDYVESLRAAIADYSVEDYENEQQRKKALKIKEIFAAGAKELEVSEETLESYGNTLIKLYPKLKDHEEQVARMAVAHMRLAKGLNEIQEVYEKYSDILTEANENSLEYHEAIGELTQALENTFGVEINTSFVKKNLKDIVNMAEGSAKALAKVQKALNEELIIHWYLEDNLEVELINELNRLSDLALNSPIGTELQLDNSKAIEAINTALETGRATIEDIERIFQNANLAMPEYKMKKIPGEVATTTTETIITDPLGFTWTTKSKGTTVTERQVPYFGDNEPNAEGLIDYSDNKLSVTTTSNSNSLSNSLNYSENSSSSKQESSKVEKIEETHKSDVVERYKEVSDILDDIADALDDINKLEDRLYGVSKIEAMKKHAAILKDESKMLYEKKKEAEEYLAEDLADINAAGLKIDAYGNISNYEEKMTALYDELSAAEKYYNNAFVGKASSDASEAYADHIAQLEDNISKTQEAIDRYDETKELIEDLDNEIRDVMYEIQDINYEILSYTLEIEIEFNDMQLKQCEYYLNKMSDDVYKMAESAAVLLDKVGLIQDNLGEYQKFYEDITEAYKSYMDMSEAGVTDYELREISQADYVEGLQKAHDGMLENLEALNELDKQMLHYYGDTLQAVAEELDKYTSVLEHHTAVLEHYKNLMGIIGRSTDYAAMGVILQGQAHTLRNELEVSQQNYEMLREQADEWKQLMETAPDEASLELYTKSWQDAEAAANEAQQEMLSKTVEWAEAMKAIVENELQQYGSELEDALTSGLGFENMTNAFERAASLQEEYLTSTNKIYETTKLMRQAQMEIDKTTNQVAKQKLKSFVNETQHLQEQTKLSNFELQIQQAKYDLLLAEIALEEAQNAKSTVRLTRDAEGNFGYVYTADQNNILDAQQAYDDAQNALYNIGLEGANDYANKQLEIMREYKDAWMQLEQDRLNGAFASEAEYHDAANALKEYYYEQWKQYSNLYSVAISTDSKIAADAWSTDLYNMMATGDEWKEATNTYLSNVEQSFSDFQLAVQEVEKLVGTDLDGITESVKGITSASDEMAKAITEQIIPTLQSELNEVKKIITEYGTLRAEVLATVATIESALSQITEDIKAAANDITALEQQLGAIKEYKDQVENGPPETGSGITPSGGAGGDKTTLVIPEDDTPDKLLDNADSNETSSDMAKDYMTEATRALDEAWRIAGADISKSEGANYETALKNYHSSAGNIIYLDYPLTKEQQQYLYDAYQKGIKSLEALYESWENQDELLAQAKKGIIELVQKKYYTTARDIYHNWLYHALGEENGMKESTKNKLKIWYETTYPQTLHPQMYATGGYTGAWGPEGKLAMLHEKEIVLNKQDTSNFLASLDLLHDIISMIDVQSASAQIGGLLTSPQYYGMENAPLEQRVQIEASFPNATDRIEIEEAFNSLVNKAAQYANRK